MESTLQNPALIAGRTILKGHHHLLLDRHRDLLPGDDLHRLL